MVARHNDYHCFIGLEPINNIGASVRVLPENPAPPTGNACVENPIMAIKALRTVCVDGELVSGTQIPKIATPGHRH